MRLVVAGLAALAACWGARPAGARSRADLAVQGVLQSEDATPSDLVVRRVPVTDAFDVVVATGAIGPAQKYHLILLLQDRADPDRVFRLDDAPSPCAPVPAIERVTATDAVFSCLAEKGERMPNEKLVYDVRTKALVGKVSYQAFAMSRIFETPSGAVAVGTDSHRLVAVAFTRGAEKPFRILSEEQAAPWIRRVRVDRADGRMSIPDDWIGDYRFGPARSFTLARLRDGGTVIREAGRRAVVRLPQSSRAEFARLRPDDFENIGHDVRIEETIGPHEREGDVLWFGKDFYDGEGDSGVGGFGTFDPLTRRFSIQSPPEIVKLSVSALDVTPESIWMGLVHYGEYGPSSGGLLSVDRKTGAVHRHELRDVVSAILRIGDVTLVATDMGLAIVTPEGDVRRFFVDVTTDGRLRIAEAVGGDASE